MKSSNQNNYAVALSKSNGSNGFSLQMRGAGNNFAFNLNDGSWSSALFNVPLIDNDEWYHVVGTFNGSTINIYVNGVAGTSGSSGTPVSTSASLFIARETGGNYFNGKIDEVAIWNTALGETAIQEIYNATANNTGKALDLSTDYNNYTSSSNLQYWNRLGD